MHSQVIITWISFTQIFEVRREGGKNTTLPDKVY